MLHIFWIVSKAGFSVSGLSQGLAWQCQVLCPNWVSPALLPTLRNQEVTGIGIGVMIQWVKVPASKPGDLSLNSETHSEVRDNLDVNSLLSTHTHTQLKF